MMLKRLWDRRDDLDFEEDSLCILLLEQEEYMIWDRLN
jgi:hypothetical protein